MSVTNKTDQNHASKNKKLQKRRYSLNLTDIELNINNFLAKLPIDFSAKTMKHQVKMQPNKQNMPIPCSFHSSDFRKTAILTNFKRQPSFFDEVHGAYQISSTPVLGRKFTVDQKHLCTQVNSKKEKNSLAILGSKMKKKGPFTAPKDESKIYKLGNIDYWYE
ncbi:MAG: hypothetical protein MHPSP_000555 [Paramarteilia canceri]